MVTKIAIEVTHKPQPGGEIYFRWADWGAEKNINADATGRVIEAKRPERLCTHGRARRRAREARRWNALALARVRLLDSDAGRKHMVGNASGWGEALTLVKIWLEHGIHYNLAAAVDRSGRLPSQGRGLRMFRISTAWVCALAALVIGAACGGTAAPSPSPATRSPSPAAASPSVSASATPKAADAVGFVSTKLADGPLPVLPAIPLYINVLDVPQPPAASTQHAHLAGFVYAVAGVHRYALQGGATTDSQPGQAVFVAQDAVHTHSNPGTTPNQWYFIALPNTNARNAAKPFPGGSTLFESADLPANALPVGKNVEQLNVVTLENCGRTSSHKHGGVR